MHPVLIDFGPWPLHTYGLLIALGFLTAMTLVKRQAEREQEDPDRIVDLAFWVLIFGLLGARLVFILTRFREYMATNPLEMLAFWRGGLVWYGGFIGASLYVFYFARRYRMNYFKLIDLCMPYAALAHAFGRLGCLAAGCCYGTHTEMPWGIVFPVGSQPQSDHQQDGLIGVGDMSLPIHPTQLYEASAEILLFLLLIWLRNRKRFHGQLFLTWMALYPLVRSVIEVFRGDKIRGVWFFGISTSQIISICVAGAAVGMYFHLRKKRLALANSA
ncbi:MAG: prolipoprotein diacylglyceryl transferase [Myxococcota bacterium]